MKTEKFKCLICGKFFEKTQEEWNKYNEELAKVDDPDKSAIKIMCPDEKCKSTKLQHLVAVKKDYIKTLLLSPIASIWDSITDTLGVLVAELIMVTNFVWNNNISHAIETLISFIAFIIAIKLVKQYLSLDILYSCGLVVTFYILKVLAKVKK